MSNFLIVFCLLALFFIFGVTVGVGTTSRDFNKKYYCKTVKELNVCAVYELKEQENKNGND